MEGVISLSQGIPDFDMPDSLKQEVSKLVLKGEGNKYTGVNGVLELREKLQVFLQENDNTQCNTDEIIITAGAIEAINAFLLTTLTHNNQEVILLDPSYAAYKNAIKIAGGNIVYCGLEQDLSLDVSKLLDCITPHTRSILINNPGNPTGSIISLDQIEEILDYISSTDIYLVLDEVYSYFILEEGLGYSSAGRLFKKYKKNLVLINSWSKTFSITGWRIGYMIGEEKLVQEIMKIQDSLITCAPSFAQYGVARSLHIIPERTKGLVKELVTSRDIVIAELSTLTQYIEFHTPQAGYYIFCKFLYTENDYEECINILNIAKVSVVPGSAFGNQGKGYFRICFGRNIPDLKQAISRLKTYFEAEKDNNIYFKGLKPSVNK